MELWIIKPSLFIGLAILKFRAKKGSRFMHDISEGIEPQRFAFD